MKLASLILSLQILLGSLLPHADYAELSKLPDLYEHYQIHQERASGHLSFADFLLMHYADSQHQQSENHERLPFQHHHSCVGIVFYFLPHFDFRFGTSQLTTPAMCRYQSFFFTSFLSSIFQPPK